MNVHLSSNSELYLKRISESMREIVEILKNHLTNNEEYEEDKCEQCKNHD